MKRLWVAGLAGLMVWLAACGGGTQPTPEPMSDILTAVEATIAAKKAQGTPMLGTPVSQLNTPAAAATPTPPPPLATDTPTATPTPSSTATATPTVTPTQGSVTEGLLVYFPFDDAVKTGDTLHDQSGQGNDGTVIGQPQAAAQGRFGGAFSLRGSDYIRLAGNPTAGRPAFSISLWFKTDAPDQDYKLASAATWQSSQGSGWVLGTRLSEAWSADHSRLMASTCYRQFAPEPKTWNHLVFTVDRTRVREYINGRLSLDCPATGQAAGSGAPLEVGAWSPLSPFNFAGLIDDFRVYGRALSAGEVMRLYAPELVGHLNDQLLGYYSFDRPAGATVKDESGAAGSAGSNDGTVTGAPGFEALGRLGGAWLFQNGSRVTLGRNPTAGLSAFAVTLWFKTDDPARDAKLATAASWKNGVGSGWTIGTSFSEFWGDDNQPLMLGKCYRSVKPRPGEWNHLAVSYDGQRLKEYVNGDPSTDCDTTRRPLGAGRPLEIGGWSSLPGFDYTGRLDEFRVYGRALSALEVRLLMETGAGQP